MFYEIYWLFEVVTPRILLMILLPFFYYIVTSQRMIVCYLVEKNHSFCYKHCLDFKGIFVMKIFIVRVTMISHSYQ